MISPIPPPIIVARLAYIRYFLDICLLLYPKAFKVPISTLSSSTILDIEVKLIKAATKKNTTGNTSAKLATLSVS